MLLITDLQKPKFMQGRLSVATGLMQSPLTKFALKLMRGAYDGGIAHFDPNHTYRGSASGMVINRRTLRQKSQQLDHFSQSSPVDIPKKSLGHAKVGLHDCWSELCSVEERNLFIAEGVIPIMRLRKRVKLEMGRGMVTVVACFIFSICTP